MHGTQPPSAHLVSASAGTNSSEDTAVKGRGDVKLSRNGRIITPSRKVHDAALTAAAEPLAKKHNNAANKTTTQGRMVISGRKISAKRSRELVETETLLASVPAEQVESALLRTVALTTDAMIIREARVRAAAEQDAAGRASAKRQRVLQRPPRCLGMSADEFRTVHACAEVEHRLDECRQEVSKRSSLHAHYSSNAAVSASNLERKQQELGGLKGKAARGAKRERVAAEASAAAAQAFEDQITVEVAAFQRAEAEAAVAGAEREVKELLGGVPRALRRRGVAAALLGASWGE